MSTETPKHVVDSKPSTDDQLIVKSGGRPSGTCYHRNHHGKPACGKVIKSRGEWVPWPPEKARAWRNECSICFPEDEQ